MRMLVKRTCEGFWVVISKVISSDGYRIRSVRKIRDLFWAYFHHCFARMPGILVEEFASYLVDFTCPLAAEVASYEGRVIDCEARDTLKQVGLTKSPVCHIKCIWGFHGCLCLFWRMYSTTGLPREPFVEMLPRVWLHYWRKVTSMFGRAPMTASRLFCSTQSERLLLADRLLPVIRSELIRNTLWREDRSKQLALGLWDPSGGWRRNCSCTDQFESVQSIW